MVQYLIVGGRTYDKREFLIFLHPATSTLAGQRQYRHRARGWWGPLVGYSEVRWLISAKYTGKDKPANFEAVVHATVPSEYPADVYDSHMENLGLEAIADWCGQFIPFDEITVKDHETVAQKGRFNQDIEVKVYDLRSHTANRRVHMVTYRWTEEEARKIGQSAIKGRR